MNGTRHEEIMMYLSGNKLTNRVSEPVLLDREEDSTALCD
jgi:hypothetical protein